MEKDFVKVVVSGEVDHGKSTLIGRLLLETRSLPLEKMEAVREGLDLAFLADQLQEEREKEMTIDTTQVLFQTKKRKYCLIDTPGHLEFIKNMMTGATHADAALVIIDAQTGLKEQTRRHVALLGLLGIRQVAVIVNKMDLVHYGKIKFLKIQKEIESLMKKTGMDLRAVVPVCAITGENIKKRSALLRWHAGPTLIQVLGGLEGEKRLLRGSLRLPVQDVYRRGPEVIVVGRIASGHLKCGQEVFVAPRGRKTRVVSLKGVGVKKNAACRGDNVGLILEDPRGIARGMVICQKNDPPEPVKSLRGTMFWIRERPLSLKEKMKFRCATQEVECVVESIATRMDPSSRAILENGATVLRLNEIGQVSIKTGVPIVAEPYRESQELGRFVLESKGSVCAVGVVTDVF